MGGFFYVCAKDNSGSAETSVLDFRQKKAALKKRGIDKVVPRGGNAQKRIALEIG
jgi:hypothetical protein